MPARSNHVRSGEVQLTRAGHDLRRSKSQLMSHDVLAPHCAVALQARQMDDGRSRQGRRQRETPQYRCRQMAHHCAGDGSEGVDASKKSIRGGGGDAHSVTGADEIPSPGATSAKRRCTGLRHGEWLVLKLWGKLAGLAHKSILRPPGAGFDVVHSPDRVWGKSGPVEAGLQVRMRGVDLPAMAATRVGFRLFLANTKGTRRRRGARLRTGGGGAI